MGKALGKHIINLYSSGISRLVKIRDVEKFQQDIENDLVIKDQMPPPPAPLPTWCTCFISDHLKTQEMCDKAVTHNRSMLDYIPDKFKTQEMYIKVVEGDPFQLRHFYDEFKTRNV